MKKHVLYSSILLGIFFVSGCQQYSKDESKFTDPANMGAWRNYCVGQYQVRLPAALEGHSVMDSYVGLKDEPMIWDKTFTERTKYEEAIKQIRKDYKAGKFLGGGQEGKTLFKQIDYPDGGIGFVEQTKRLVTPKNKKRAATYVYHYDVYSYFLIKQPFRIFRFVNHNVSEDDLKSVISLNQHLAYSLQGRENNALPKDKGVCIDGGFIRGEMDLKSYHRLAVNAPYRSERSDLSIRFISHESTSEFPAPEKFHRADEKRSFPSNRRVNNMAGQETIIKGRNPTDASEYAFNWQEDHNLIVREDNDSVKKRRKRPGRAKADDVPQANVPKPDPRFTELQIVMEVVPHRFVKPSAGSKMEITEPAPSPEIESVAKEPTKNKSSSSDWLANRRNVKPTGFSNREMMVSTQPEIVVQKSAVSEAIAESDDKEIVSTRKTTTTKATTFQKTDAQTGYLEFKDGKAAEAFWNTLLSDVKNRTKEDVKNSKKKK